jgi:hypothetical protein
MDPFPALCDGFIRQADYCETRIARRNLALNFNATRLKPEVSDRLNRGDHQLASPRKSIGLRRQLAEFLPINRPISPPNTVRKIRDYCGLPDMSSLYNVLFHLGKEPLTHAPNVFETVGRAIRSLNMPMPTNLSSARMGTASSRAFGLSFTALLETVRWVFLLSPVLFAVPQAARAGAFSTTSEIVDYEDVPEEIPQTTAIARFGPFAVADAKTVELYGTIDAHSPEEFRKLVAAYPGVSLIRMIECPGTLDDEANFEVARMVRARGMATLVPATGSVRSGGVELFLAGVKRTAETGAEFGVHSWQDDEGQQAKDAPADDDTASEYVNYYKAMGLAPDTAKAFYAFTNKTAFENIHYMTPAELAQFHLTN